MIRQKITTERKERIFFSVQFQAILAEVLKIEHLHEMDVDFRNPTINNFASRIGKDAESIIKHLKTDPKVGFKNTDSEFTIEYAAEMHRLFRNFMGKDIKDIREFNDGTEKLIQSNETG